MKPVSFLCGLAVASVVSLTTSGLNDARAEEASPTTTSTAPELTFERYLLDNGMEVILHQDDSAPLVAVNLWYHVGSGDETPGKTGFAHLFEHMMFQGAKHIGEDVHFDLLKRIGASGINGTTNSDRTNYFEVVPSNQLETALWLESDRMGYMLDLLNEKSLANQRDVVRNERRQRYDNVPYGKARFAVAETMFPEGHPYRYMTIGRHEDLEAASLEDVRKFFNRWYAPSNATLVIAGDFATDDAKALVTKWFGSFPTLPKPDHTAPAPVKLDANKRVEVEDPFARLEQVQYVWQSAPMLGEGDLALDGVAAVLSADGWGRLEKRLKLDEGLVRYVAAYQWGSGFSGTFNIVAQLKPGASRERVEAIINEEVQRMIDTPVEPQEIKRMVLRAKSGFVWRLETLAGRADQLQFFNHYTGDPGYLRTYVERLDSLTPAQLQAAAKNFLSAPRVEVITVPKGAQ
ncbi:MAG: M16 family metallopeptidase [Nannocystaceae bacterium]